MLQDEFKNSTVEHARMLGELFARLRHLHNWFIGEYSMVQQIAYNSVVAIAVVVCTSGRLVVVRPQLFATLAGGWAAERVVQYVWLMEPPTGAVLDDQFYSTIWRLRKICVACIMLLYVRSIFRYDNRDRQLLDLLQVVQQQNREILYEIQRRPLSSIEQQVVTTTGVISDVVERRTSNRLIKMKCTL